MMVFVGEGTGLFLVDVEADLLPNIVPPIPLFKSADNPRTLGVYFEELMAWINRAFEARSKSLPTWYKYVSSVPTDPDTGEPEIVTGRFQVKTGFPPFEVVVHPDAPEGTTEAQAEDGWVEGAAARFQDVFTEDAIIADQDAFRKKIIPMEVLDEGEETERVVQNLKGSEGHWVNIYEDLLAQLREMEVEGDLGEVAGQWYSFELFNRLHNMATAQDTLFTNLGIDLDSLGGQGFATARDVLLGRNGIPDIVADAFRPSGMYGVWEVGDDRLFIVNMITAKRDGNGDRAIENVLRIRFADGTPVPIRSVSANGFNGISAQPVAGNAPGTMWYLVLDTSGNLYMVAADGHVTGTVVFAAGGLAGTLDWLAGDVPIIPELGDEGDAGSVGGPFGVLFDGSKAKVQSVSGGGTLTGNHITPGGFALATRRDGTAGSGGGNRIHVVNAAGVAVKDEDAPSDESVWTIPFPHTDAHTMQREGLVELLPDIILSFDGTNRVLNWLTYDVSGSQKDTYSPEDSGQVCSFGTTEDAKTQLPEGTLRGRPLAQSTWQLRPASFQLRAKFRSKFPELVVPTAAFPDSSGESNRKDVSLRGDIEEAPYIVIGDPWLTEEEITTGRAGSFDPFNVIFMGVGNQVFTSLTLSKATVPDPAAATEEQAEAEAERAEAAGEDPEFVEGDPIGDDAGFVPVTVRRSARGRFHIRVQDAFKIEIPRIITEIVEDAEGEEVEVQSYATTRRQHTESWKVFERTWPINDGDLAPEPISESGRAPRGETDENRALLDFYAASTQASLFPSTVSPNDLHLHGMSATSSDEEVAELDRDVDDITQPSSEIPFGTTDLVYFARLKTKTVGSTVLTFGDQGTGDIISFILNVWRVKPLEDLLEVGVPVTLEIEGTVSLPVRWSVSNLELATVANDPTDPKKAILLPLKATEEDEEGETELLKVFATDANEGYFTLAELGIMPES